jgi:hypothetical protein
MSDRSQLIALPARIHAFLADGIERHGCGGGRDPRRVVEALPQSLPTGRVERLVSGGPFGWIIDALQGGLGLLHLAALLPHRA